VAPLTSILCAHIEPNLPAAKLAELRALLAGMADGSAPSKPVRMFDAGEEAAG
jgi:hypothetical protein